MKTLWITWEEQRRNKEIADSIGAEFHQIIVPGGRIKRYLGSLWKTFNIYLKARATTVICQNPSVVLALFTVLTRWLFRFKVGIDTHNGGLALDTNSKLLKKAALFLQRNADFIIITNEPLKRLVESNGGKAVVLPDKIPTIEKPKELLQFPHKFNFLFICTFAKDEPYGAVFQAASLLERENIGIWVTGNYKGKIEPINYPPSNLHFTGRVPWEEFDQFLYSVNGIIDLTTREYCLVCGAYEAVAVGKPLILSNTEALYTYFNKGACYADNSPKQLAAAMRRVISWQNDFLDEVYWLKVELNRNWEESKQKLMELL